MAEHEKAPPRPGPGQNEGQAEEAQSLGKIPPGLESVKSPREEHTNWVQIAQDVLTKALSKSSLEAWHDLNTPVELFPPRFQEIAQALNKSLANKSPLEALLENSPDSTHAWSEAALYAPLGVSLESLIQALRTARDRFKIAQGMKDGDLEAVAKVIHRSTQEIPDTSSLGFQLVRAGDLECKAPQWLIRDYLEADSLAIAFGDPAAGKSFLGTDIALSLAAGVDFHGQEVDPGPVIYIEGEGHNGRARRDKAWGSRRGVDISQTPFFVSTGPAALCDPDSLQEVLQAVDQVAQSEPPKLVVIDTLARNFGPGDESSTRDMSLFVQAADSLRVRYGCTVLVIHHVGHGNKDRARGAMALKGAADAEYRIEKDESGVVRLIPVKMKDAALPEPMAFKLRTVELDFQDENGQDVTSAILDRIEYEPPQQDDVSNQPKRRGKGKNQSEALRQLDRLLAENRERLERGGFDPNQARIRIEDWRDAVIEAVGINRKRWSEIKKSLENAGYVESDGNYVRPL